jgi:hypothetical protein
MENISTAPFTSPYQYPCKVGKPEMGRDHLEDLGIDGR